MEKDNLDKVIYSRTKEPSDIICNNSGRLFFYKTVDEKIKHTTQNVYMYVIRKTSSVSINDYVIDDIYGKKKPKRIISIFDYENQTVKITLDDQTLYNPDIHGKVLVSNDPSIDVSRPSDVFMQNLCDNNGIDEVYAYLNVDGSYDLKFTQDLNMDLVRVIPTLSTDMLKSWFVINVSDTLTEQWNKIEEEYFLKYPSWGKELNPDEKNQRKIDFKANRLWYEENIEKVYLPKELKIYAPNIDRTVEEINMDLWDCDYSHYGCTHKDSGYIYLSTERDIKF